MTNKEILERTGLPSMEDLLIRKNLRWTGHLMRMSPDRLPKQVLYSQLSSGHSKRGRPRLRVKDTIKRNLKMRDIKIDSWTSLSQQRDTQPSDGSSLCRFATDSMMMMMMMMMMMIMSINKTYFDLVATFRMIFRGKLEGGIYPYHFTCISD